MRNLGNFIQIMHEYFLEHYIMSKTEINERNSNLAAGIEIFFLICALLC